MDRRFEHTIQYNTRRQRAHSPWPKIKLARPNQWQAPAKTAALRPPLRPAQPLTPLALHHTQTLPPQAQRPAQPDRH